MSKLVDVLFDCCTHARYRFPISVRAGQRRPKAAGMTGMYVVCVDCGKEFAYSWDEMRVIFASPVRSPCQPVLRRQLWNGMVLRSISLLNTCNPILGTTARAASLLSESSP